MTPLAWTSIGLGCVIIATRAPLLFAPDATVEFLRRLIETSTRMRVCGLVIIPLGGLMVLGSSYEVGTFASFLSGLGWAIMLGCFSVLVLFPGLYRSFATWLIENLGDVWRPIGAIGMAVGIAFIWVGFTLE